LFDVIHRRDLMKPGTVTATLKILGDVLCRTAVKDVPGTAEARNLARRFQKHGASYIRFITTPGIEPTNNHAERELRAFVMWRKRSFGTQSDRGNVFAERLMTVAHTARKQGREVLPFLTACCEAHLAGTHAPSLFAAA